jgi:opacity protein-like surface antigen
MTNKTTKICCTLALLASVAATPALSQTKGFEGLSLGVGGTFTSSNTDTSLTTSLSSFKIKSGDYSNVAFIDASYGIPVSNNFLLSFGGRYDLGKNKGGSLSTSATAEAGSLVWDDGLGGATPTSEDITETINLNYDYKDHYSIYIAPTYILNNTTAFFGKIGYHTQKGTLNYSEKYAGAVPDLAELGFEDYSASRSKNFSGYGYGVGFKTLISNNLYLQLDVDYIDYDSENFTSGNVSYKFKPESVNAALSLGYKF